MEIVLFDDEFIWIFKMTTSKSVTQNIYYLSDSHIQKV